MPRSLQHPIAGIAAYFALFALSTLALLLFPSFANAQCYSGPGQTYQAGVQANAAAYYSTAVGYGAQALCENSIALGHNALVDGGPGAGMAIGNSSHASAPNASAIGHWATAGGNGAQSLGGGARANGDMSTALGASAHADHYLSSAVGALAQTSRDYQVAIGTPDNTYTLAGIASPSSSAAQTGFQRWAVTTDEHGNLSVTDFPTNVTIIDDLVTGGSYDALSAEQGRILNTHMDDLNLEVANVNDTAQQALVAAQDAGTIATEANTKADTLLSSMGALQTSVADTRSRADEAHGIAQAAQQGADAAQDLANSAATAALDAEIAAADAYDLAERADANATDAQQNATFALQTASNARDSAQLATTTATVARLDASEARTLAVAANASALQRTGGSMTGNINMGGNRITHVAAPVDPTDAANKAYVDTRFESVNTDFAAANARVNQLSRQTEINTEGIAVAIAMGGLAMPSDADFAIGANVGFFNGEQAFAAQTAVRVNKNIIFNSAIGMAAGEGGTVGGRMGLSAAW